MTRHGPLIKCLLQHMHSTTSIMQSGVGYGLGQLKLYLLNPYLKGKPIILYISHCSYYSKKGSRQEDRDVGILHHLHDKKITGNEELPHLQWNIFQDTKGVLDRLISQLQGDGSRVQFSYLQPFTGRLGHVANTSPKITQCPTNGNIPHGTRDGESSRIIKFGRKLVLNYDAALLSDRYYSMLSSFPLLESKSFKNLTQDGMLVIASIKGILMWNLFSISKNFPYFCLFFTLTSL